MLVNTFREKLLTIVMLIAMVLVQLPIHAQDDVVTDEELMSYIAVSAKIDTLMAQMMAKTNDLVKGNELMDGGRVFNAIKNAKGDSAKIAVLEVSKAQLDAYAQINDGIDQMKADFKEDYSTLIKDELGAGLYNKVKKGLRSDADLKARYEEAAAQYTPASMEETEEG